MLPQDFPAFILTVNLTAIVNLSSNMQTIPSASSNPGWRALRRCLIGFAGLVTLIALFYAEEDVRGHLAWNSYLREAARRGIDMNFRDLVPPPVADDQNFAMTPFLAPLLDFNPKPLASGQSPWRNQPGQDRAMNYFKNFNAALNSVPNQHTNPEEPWTDLGDLARALQKKSQSSSAAAIATRADAAREILGAFEAYKPVLDELREAEATGLIPVLISVTRMKTRAGILLPHLAVLKNVGQVLEVSRRFRTDLGTQGMRLDDDLGLVLSLAAETIRNEPILISQLVRFAILTQAEQITWEGLASHSWSEEKLHDLQSRFRRETHRLERFSTIAPRRASFFWHAAFLITFRANPKAFGDIMRTDHDAPTTPHIMIEAFASFAPRGWSYLEETSYNRLYDAEFEGVFRC